MLKNNIIFYIFFLLVTVVIFFILLHKINNLETENNYLIQNKINDLELEKNILSKQEQALTDQQNKMNDYYLYEFAYAYLNYLNGRRLWVQDCQLNNSIKELQHKMLQDGYKHFEIDEIKNEGKEIALDHYNQHP